MIDVLTARPALFDAGRSADGQRTRRDLGVVEHDRVGSDDGAGPNDAAMQHLGVIADEHAVFDGAALEMDLVPEGAVVADDRERERRGVQHSIVLHAGSVTHADLATVTAEHRPRPHRRVSADGDRADDDGIGMDVGIGVNVGNLIAQCVDGHARNVVRCLGASRIRLRNRYGLAPMPRRIEIELTSELPDGSWTWRAAGAKNPKGTVDGSVLPSGSAVGDELKVEVEQDIEGIQVLSVIKGREKKAPDVLELLPSEEKFEAVIQTRAKRDRGDRGDRGGKGGRDRRDRRGRGKGRDGDADGGDRRGPRRPRFEAPPEVPQRPKPKRLRPGKAKRNEVLSELPEEQRPVAEVALQGMQAVRQRLAEENKRLEADGKPAMPEASVLKMAEELLPRLRVADWLDRAEAARRQLENLDLRDLRSVVAAANDPVVARDESTRELAEQLKKDLVTKQEEELKLWEQDIEAALGVGRSIRALRLSSQPPKAGVMFPPELARKLGEAATASLTADDFSDRWIAVMEAAAFSPVRTLVTPAEPPKQITDDLKKTALRLGPLLPQVAALLGVEVPADQPQPKPLRPQRPDNKRKRAAKRPEGDTPSAPAG